MRRIISLESALVLSCFTLVLQLGWPLLTKLRHRPHPGRQVSQFWEQDYAGLAPHFWLYLPYNYGKSEELPPLILYLHGAGERGNSPDRTGTIGISSLVSKNRALDAVVVAPQCLPQFNWHSASLSSALHEVAKRYRTDPRRVYVVGFSMGAFGAWELATDYPESIAAIVPVAGGGNTTLAARLKNVPIWAIHGELDGVVSPSLSIEMVAAVNAAGGRAKLMLLPARKHDLQSILRGHAEVLDWLLAQQLQTAHDQNE